MNKLQKILSMLLLVFGFIIVLSPYLLFPVCTAVRPNGGPMSCYYTAKLVFALGIILLLVSFFVVRKNNKCFYTLESLTAIAVGFLGYALPNRIIPLGDMQRMNWQIAYCMKPTMTCNSTLKPAMNIIMPMVLFLGVMLMIMNILSKSEA